MKLFIMQRAGEGQGDGPRWAGAPTGPIGQGAEYAEPINRARVSKKLANNIFCPALIAQSDNLFSPAGKQALGVGLIR